MVTYEVCSCQNTERRMAALGGHGFKVYAALGHAQIGLYPELWQTMSPLIHDTDSVELIYKSGALSGMTRKGGINFCVQKSAGYRPEATHEVTVNLPIAIADGFCFFENRFSRLVFGMGRWNWEMDWWDCKIPLEYLGIRRHQI